MNGSREKSERNLRDAGAAMGMGCVNMEDRVMASLGMLGEAPVRFQALNSVSYGGVLLSLPALWAAGLVRHIDNYFQLAKGYYSLRQIFLVLGLSIMLRAKTIEGIKHFFAGEMGKLLGLDRIPEIRTLRKKLDALAESGQIGAWSQALSRDWMASFPELAGALYVDGHVRVYYGSRAQLPKRYIARYKLCMRGTTDYWVNDIYGQPFFVIGTPFNEGLISMLKREIIPRLLDDVPNQPSEAELKADRFRYRFLMVFDREGYSPKFFRQIWREWRIGCCTYKKYPGELWEDDEFELYSFPFPNGEIVSMKLAERGVYLGDELWVREIRKLTSSGHQTSIVTTDYISDTAQIAAVMFSRWTQENFFKYMIENYGIDRLIQYDTEAVYDTALVVNPEYRRIDSEIRSKTSTLTRLLAKFGGLSLPEDLNESKKMKSCQARKAELHETIICLRHDIDALKARRKEIPNHIKFNELAPVDQFSKLAADKKHLMDTLKMIAYRAETSLVNTIRDQLSKSDNPRDLITSLFYQEADLRPDKNSNQLIISIHHTNNQKTDKILQFLCEKLNETETVFPGTDLTLVYKLVSN